jgi:hypothetical protein
MVPFLAHCGDGVVPIPDQFRAAFATGRMCVPNQNGNATATTTFPIRVEYCRYRCISVGSPIQLYTSWQCLGGACQMVMLLTAQANRIATEQGCDGRNLENPPASECIPEVYEFDADVPYADTMPLPGPFQVTVPYLDLDQAERVIARLDAGERPLDVISQEVGVQNYPGRQFAIEFGPNYPSLDTAAETDCKTIPLP